MIEKIVSIAVVAFIGMFFAYFRGKKTAKAAEQERKKKEILDTVKTVLENENDINSATVTDIRDRLRKYYRG